ncbi:MAG: hypothetical protein IKL05_03530 [Clostridia bacterium]|nr:hypothetical protein [Clostridia bacterium]
METKGEINISPNYNKDSYLNLNLSLQSSESDWNMAVAILKDRIEGRYFNQIDLLSNDVNANGFTIMALNCLLIETLFQFRDGEEETPRPNNKTYPAFLLQEFSSVFRDQKTAKSFYANIRCGILHSAQTKNESRLSDREDVVVTFEGNTLVVSVKGVSSLLKTYFEHYLQKLSNPKEVTLRNNFINKMKFVCRK